MFEDKVIPLDTWVSQFVEWLVDNYRSIFQALKWPVEKTLSGFDTGLNALPPWLVIIAIALLAWKFSGVKLAIFTVVSLTFIGLLGLWQDTMTTFAMVLSAVIFCAVVGIPLGIASGRNDKFQAGIRPILDAMQTTPAFVYLVPIVMLFSVGNVAGVLATIVFALPPIIRLTSLGIRQVHPELVEAPGLRRHPLASPAAGPGSPGHAHYSGWTEPDDHDGAFHGGDCRPDRRRRSGFPGDPRPEHPGHRPGGDRRSGDCVDGDCTGPDHPVHGAEKVIPQSA